MPTGRNWINFLYINIGFVAQILVLLLLLKKKEIQDDWNTYKCDPMYMPIFSKDPTADFAACVGTIQSDTMDQLTAPITKTIDGLADLGGSLSEDINGARGALSSVRNSASAITQKTFGVFLNITTEFQKMSVSIKDLVGKFLGTMVSVMYIMEGSHKTMVSIQKGPPGQLLNTLACFSPDTMITLNTGDHVMMKDVKLNDVLKNGTIVHATMQISNSGASPYYKMQSTNQPSGYIYVTGEHYVKHKDHFIPVKYHPGAEYVPTKVDDVVMCLITSDHRIPIDDYEFWDWDDDLIPYKLLKRF
jgi:hypothetical protein